MFNFNIIFFGLIIGVCYILFSYFYFKNIPTLEKFIVMFSSAFTIGVSIEIIFLLLSNLDNPSAMGIFSKNKEYIFLGSCSIIWVSISQIISIFRKMKQS